MSSAEQTHNVHTAWHGCSVHLLCMEEQNLSHNAVTKLEDLCSCGMMTMLDVLHTQTVV